MYWYCSHQPRCQAAMQHLLRTEWGLTEDMDTAQYYVYLRHTPFSFLFAALQKSNKEKVAAEKLLVSSS